MGRWVIHTTSALALCACACGGAPTDVPGGELEEGDSAPRAPQLSLSGDQHVVVEVPTATGAVVFASLGDAVSVFEYGTTTDPREMALPRLRGEGTPLEQYMTLTGIEQSSTPPELLSDHRARSDDAPSRLPFRTDGEVVRDAARVTTLSGTPALVEKGSYQANVASECSWELATFVAAMTLLSEGAQGTLVDHCSQGSNSNHCQKANDSWAITGAIRNGYGRALGMCNVSGDVSIMQMILRYRDLNGWHDQLFGWWEIPSGFWVAWADIGFTWENNPEYYEVYQQADGETASGAVYSGF